jgi:hypothetical protein
MTQQLTKGLYSLLLGLVLLVTGCQTHRQVVEQAHESFWQGDLERSGLELAKAAERPRNDLAVLQLDQAMVEFQKGNFADSQHLLKQVRGELSAIPPASETARSAVSYLTDDTRRAYTGEDHEKLLLPAMLALNSLLRADGDAVAYAHQLGDECAALLDNRPLEPIAAEPVPTPPTPAQPTVNPAVTLNPAVTVNPAVAGPPTATMIPAGPTNQAEPVQQVVLSDTPPAMPLVPKIDPIRFELAFGPLLRAVIRGQSVLNHDDVIRHLQTANDWRPGSEFLQLELARAVAGQQAPQGYGSLYVIALVGRGPRKVTGTEEVTSQALLVADQLLSALGDYTLPPTVAPIKIARIELAPITVESLRISINRQEMGLTENVGDIGRLAVARQKELMPQIVGRAVARRVLKKGIIVAGKSASGADKESGNDLTSLLYTAAGVAWEAAEQADLRGWSLLPGSIQVYRVDLPCGAHQLDLRGELQGRTVSSRFGTPVQIRDGQATFAIATLPDQQATGRVFATQ